MRPDIQVGTKICVKGRGASTGHWHGEVRRLTRTQVFVASFRRPLERAFRREDGRSIPYNGYYADTQCQI